MAEPDKVKVMRQMFPPTCIREVSSFVGMCSYYRRFIPDLLLDKPRNLQSLNGVKNVRLLFTFPKRANNSASFSLPQILTNHLFSIQMLVMITLGHAFAKSRIHKGKWNQISQMKSLFTICHINFQQTNWPTIEKEVFTIFYGSTEIRSVYAWLWICYQNRAQNPQVHAYHGFPSTEKRFITGPQTSLAIIVILNT